jgi:hypothetical protein
MVEYPKGPRRALVPLLRIVSIFHRCYVTIFLDRFQELLTFHLIYNVTPALCELPCPSDTQTSLTSGACHQVETLTIRLRLSPLGTVQLWTQTGSVGIWAA